MDVTECESNQNYAEQCLHCLTNTLLPDISECTCSHVDITF